ncbi:hypothetical protein AAVH_24950 [Aphelenchoides avenae]|nr:hypothetical protein AAVH_24950 [Aphelenchus avenae]
MTRVYGWPTSGALVAVVFAYSKRETGYIYVELSSASKGERYGPKRIDHGDGLKPSLVAHGLEMYFLQEVALDPKVYRCRD